VGSGVPPGPKGDGGSWDPGRGERPPDHARLWRALLSAWPGFAWLKSADGRYLDANDAFVRHFGRRRDELPGLTDRDITDAATAAAFGASDALAMALPPGTPLRRDEEVVLADGQRDLFELTKLAVHDEHGRPRWVIGLGRAIGDAQRAQRQRDEAAQRLALALEGGELAHWDMEVATGRVWLLDDRLCVWLGYDAATIPHDAAGFDALVHPDDRAHRQAALREHWLGRTALFESEHRLRHARGHWIWLLTRAKFIERAPDGKPLRLSGVTLDITWRKQAQAEAQAHATAMQLAQAQGELLSRMSHELRTPLNAVLGFTQLMRLAQAQGQPLRPDYLVMVDDAARQLLRLVEDALQLRGVALGLPALAAARVPLREAVDEALALVAPLAVAHPVTAANEVPAGSAVAADPAALRQVLVNLLSNAIRFNRAGGTVRVAAVPGGVEIVDTGAGLAPAEVARLFQPFERLGREQAPGAGTGLGLLIARSLARAMGGEVTLDSEKGVGTRACLRLPPAA
jgi:PAS domain S-box-containing protein